MKVKLDLTRIHHNDRDADLAIFSMGCAASLFVKRLDRMSINAPSWVNIHLIYLTHRKTNMPEYGGEVMVTKILGLCGLDVCPTGFYHLNPIGSESRGTLSLDGRIPTPAQSIIEIVIRHFVNQQIAV